MTRATAFKQRGFTLIEMVVVVAIIGILAGAAVPLVELSAQRSKELALHQGLRSLREAIDAYKQAADAKRIATADGASGYPPSLQVLVDGAPLAGEGGRAEPGVKRLYFLRRMPRDPFADPSLPAAETWGLRASTSPPDAPAPGDDVFDVYSHAAGRALDGSSYRDW